MITEQIDKLYLELSQFTQAKTSRELALEEQLAAAEAARVIAEEQLTVICNGVNRRCGCDNNQLPLVSLDRLLTAHERDIAEFRGLLREVLRGRRRFMRDTLAKELYEAVEKAGGVE